MESNENLSGVDKQPKSDEVFEREYKMREFGRECVTKIAHYSARGNGDVSSSMYSPLENGVENNLFSVEQIERLGKIVEEIEALLKEVRRG